MSYYIDEVYLNNQNTYGKYLHGQLVDKIDREGNLLYGY